MSAPYPGSPAFPASILLPDDGEPIEAGSVNVPFEGVADRTVWLHQRCFAVAEFLVPAAAWVAPTGVAYAIAVGYGGGGGGGGATDGLALDDAFAMGAGGGGGAPEQMAIIPLVAGATYAIDIGIGGTGGVNGAPYGTAGLPGQASTVTRVSTGEVLCEFGGGGGGGPGASNAAPVGSTFMALGGPPWAYFSDDEWVGPSFGTSITTLSWTTAAPVVRYPLPPGSGGPAYHVRPPGSRAGRNGLPQRTRVRYAAGMGIAGFGGAPGADSGLRRGGAGGGGGGGGPTGSAGDGGNGGDGNNAGVAVAGANGGSAAPNSGGGGGGGGGGGAGNGPANNGVGGTGGTGGSGRVRLYAFGIRP